MSRTIRIKKEDLPKSRLPTAKGEIVHKDKSKYIRKEERRKTNNIKRNKKEPHE